MKKALNFQRVLIWNRIDEGISEKAKSPFHRRCVALGTSAQDLGKCSRCCEKTTHLPTVSGSSTNAPSSVVSTLLTHY